MLQSAVFVAGLGVVSPFGSGIDCYWDGLMSGQSAMTICDPFHLGAEFRGPFGIIQESGYSAFSIARDAVDQALLDAKISVEELPVFGLYVASAHGESSLLSELVDRLTEGSALQASPSGLLNDLLVDQLDAHLGRRALFTRNIKAACASTNVALAWASDDLASERIDAALIVSVDTLSRAGTAGFRALGALAKEKIRPFSTHRDGTLIGEGAAAILLLKDRMADAIRVRTVGLSGDLDKHPIQSNGDGLGIELAIRRALGETPPSQIGLIVYHATGTVQNDAAEAKACLRIFGEQLPVGYALKPAIGHSMGAASGMSFIAAVLMMKARLVPPTLNIIQTELEFELPFAVESTPYCAINSALVNGFGFGGINSTVLLTR